MYELTDADRIWNRACYRDPSLSLPGDRALNDLLLAHGYTMNGGVLHAIECLSPSELAAAQAGYRYYGFDSIASLLALARDIFEAGKDLGDHETRLDDKYSTVIWLDKTLSDAFEKRLKLCPSDFAPLRPQDRV